MGNNNHETVMYYSAQTTAGHYSAQTTAGRRWPPLPSHFILAKVMPMTTPAARAAAAMASTPEEGSMDGDLGQEESHAHLGAQRKGHRRRWTGTSAVMLLGP